jgi:8-oxo-dGTP pyrophosphatase MutT (NUDIX family)
MRWITHGRRPVYRSEWVELWLDDVEIPGERRFEHHVLRFPRGGVGTVVVNDRDETLLLWRHRFITDTWGWEIPAGWTDPGEEPADAARREVEEETGYRPTTIEPLLDYNPMNGISAHRFRTFLCTAADHIGPPTDTSESIRVEWVPLADVPRLAADGHLKDGPSITGLSYYLMRRDASR